MLAEPTSRWPTGRLAISRKISITLLIRCLGLEPTVRRCPIQASKSLNHFSGQRSPMQDLRVSVPRAAIVATLCALAWVGCNSKPKGPPTVEVTGIVTLNGMPVEGATVLFSPAVGTDDPRLASQA